MPIHYALLAGLLLSGMTLESFWPLRPWRMGNGTIPARLGSGSQPRRFTTTLKPQVQDAARRQNRDQAPVLHGSGDKELVKF